MCNLIVENSAYTGKIKKSEELYQKK